MSLSMADVTLSGFKEPNWTYIYLFHIYMRDHVAMSVCDQCDYKANSKGYLWTHMKSIHEGV